MAMRAVRFAAAPALSTPAAAQMVLLICVNQTDGSCVAGAVRWECRGPGCGGATFYGPCIIERSDPSQRKF